MSFEVLYYLRNEKTSIIEIKRTDLEESSPKNLVYKWLVVDDSGDIQGLVFESMRSELVSGKKIDIRLFQNSELRFDALFGQFVMEDELFILENCSDKVLPEAIMDKLVNYFKN